MPHPTRAQRTAQADQASADFWATFDTPALAVTMEYAPPLTGEEAYLKIYGRPLGGATRQRPRRSDKDRIRERQAGRCLYCGELIGGLVLRRNSVVELRAAWDHFVPYAYAARNGHDNWVLACHLCNGIKHAKMFDTVLDAQQFIQARWVEKRIELIDPALQARIRAGEL